MLGYRCFISSRVDRRGSEVHVVIGAPRPVTGSARSDKVCHIEIRRAGTVVRLRPQPGSTRVALDNALGEVTRHLGIDLPVVRDRSHQIGHRTSFRFTDRSGRFCPAFGTTLSIT
ncbi:hypothetical protein ACFXPR_35690 [Nocardia tengchongensis]|uniref:hypothetical protein n=1 Tax=Nocardia tengchongensis TaxID=2055889 RepID=UPI0036AE2080